MFVQAYMLFLVVFLSSRKTYIFILVHNVNPSSFVIVHKLGM